MAVDIIIYLKSHVYLHNIGIFDLLSQNIDVININFDFYLQIMSSYLEFFLTFMTRNFEFRRCDFYYSYYRYIISKYGDDTNDGSNIIMYYKYKRDHFILTIKQ